jgi:hypothetical protein
MPEHPELRPSVTRRHPRTPAPHLTTLGERTSPACRRRRWLDLRLLLGQGSTSIAQVGAISRGGSSGELHRHPQFTDQRPDA